MRIVNPWHLDQFLAAFRDRTRPIDRDLVPSPQRCIDRDPPVQIRLFADSLPIDSVWIRTCTKDLLSLVGQRTIN